MHISVIRSYAEFEALGPEWQGLHQRARGASVFNSWEWQYAWWREYGRGASLCIVLARDAGVLVGILPVYIDTVRLFYFFPVRILRFLGVGGDTSPDDLDAMLDPDRTGETATALAAAVRDDLVHDWDVLQLTDMADDSAYRTVLRKALEQFSAREGVSASIAFLSLPDSWDSYLENLHRDRRYTMRQTRRRVEAQPGARFYVWQESARLDEAIDRLIALHHLRWHGRGEPYAFSTPGYVNFHRRVMHACHKQGWLRLYCLEVDATIIAMYYCYRFRNRIFYFQGGFDPAHSKLRPGLVLMGHAIEHAIGEGNDVFDMLRGDYEYKTQWAKERRQTYYLLARRRNPMALVYRLRREWLPALKHCLMRPGRRSTVSAARTGAAPDA